MKKVRLSTGDTALKRGLPALLNGCETAVLLDSHDGPVPVTGSRYRFVCAGGCVASVSGGTLAELDRFLRDQRAQSRWVFGFLTYDLKNELESLNSSGPDRTGFPRLHFFAPEWVITGDDEHITVTAPAPDALIQNVYETADFPGTGFPFEVVSAHIPGRDSYHRAFAAIMNHLRRGDIYEVNYCRQLVAQLTNPDPLRMYLKLSETAPAPFACYYKTGPHHLACASPERFVARRGNTLYAQPMKGTMRRDPDAATDALLKTQLASSEKERSENVMIVDLVRNDLSRVAKRGTVQVEELFGVYTFPNVHQMISTIRCEVDHAVSFTDVVRALFPMGSMTGAPKISAMNIIEELEGFRRSLYSGTVGYIDPSGDFDFNVVIRSLLCNTHTGLVTAAAGGAITAGSDPEQEFAETELKMKPLLHMLGIDPAAADITDRHAERI